MAPEDMATYAKKYVELGAKVVGGCCGNTPEHVAAIAKAVKGQ
jgi:methionine synthase I (cobalamin-dependent)